jgi:outer membrane murein-binding lipoprotein Lpp
MTKYARFAVVMGMLLAGCQDDAGTAARPGIDPEDAKTLDAAAAQLDTESTAANPE